MHLHLYIKKNLPIGIASGHTSYMWDRLFLRNHLQRSLPVNLEHQNPTPSMCEAKMQIP